MAILQEEKKSVEKTIDKVNTDFINSAILRIDIAKTDFLIIVIEAFGICIVTHFFSHSERLYILSI